MIYECNETSLKSIHNDIMSDLVVKLEIRYSEGKYYADVVTSAAPVGASIDTRVQNANIVHRFSSMLSLDKVSKFAYTYIPLERKSILVEAYLTNVESIDSKEQLDKALQKVQKLVFDLGLEDKVFDNLSTKKMNGNKPKYEKATAKDLINALLEGLK